MKFRCVPGSRVRSVVAAKTMEVGALGPAVSSYTRVVPQGSPCTPEYTRVAPLLVELQHRSHVLKVASSPPLRVREWPLREKYDKGWKSTCKHTLLKDGRQHQTINKMRRRSMTNRRRPHSFSLRAKACQLEVRVLHVFVWSVYVVKHFLITVYFREVSITGCRSNEVETSSNHRRHHLVVNQPLSQISRELQQAQLMAHCF